MTRRGPRTATPIPPSPPAPDKVWRTRILLSPPPVPPTAAASPAAFGFAGATLGQSLASWRQGSPEAISTPCVRSGDATIRCRLPDQPLGGAYAARGLTLTFSRGSLTTIDFLTSANGLDWVTALFRRRFGDPDQIVRDRRTLVDGVSLPHLRMSWRSGADRIEIDDPTRCGAWLRVRLSVASLGPSPAQVTLPCNPPL